MEFTVSKGNSRLKVGGEKNGERPGARRGGKSGQLHLVGIHSVLPSTRNLRIWKVGGKNSRGVGVLFLSFQVLPREG